MWAPHFRMEPIFFQRGNALRQNGAPKYVAAVLHKSG